MPNWCYTSYVIDGKRKEVQSLFSKMNNLENEDFLHTLEDKYEFRLRDCEWMSVNEITEREYGM